MGIQVSTRISLHPVIQQYWTVVDVHILTLNASIINSYNIWSIWFKRWCKWTEEWFSYIIKRDCLNLIHISVNIIILYNVKVTTIWISLLSYMCMFNMHAQSHKMTWVLHFCTTWLFIQLNYFGEHSWIKKYEEVENK